MKHLSSFVALSAACVELLACSGASNSPQDGAIMMNESGLMTSPDSTAAQASDASEELQPIPGGYLIPRSCVHTVANGSRLEKRGNELLIDGSRLPISTNCANRAKHARLSNDASSDAIVPDPNDPWVEASAAYCPANPFGGNFCTGIYGSWTVPANPTSNPNTLFIWNGLEDSFHGYSQFVIQPVLQYQYDSSRGRYMWRVASWYVADINGQISAVHSPLADVAVGDLIEGATHVANSCGGGICDWDVSIRRNGVLASVLYVPMTLSSTRVAYKAVFEAYGVTTCAQMPVRMTFRGTQLWEAGPGMDNWHVPVTISNSSWQNIVYWQTPSCHYRVISPDTQTAILYAF